MRLKVFVERESKEFELDFQGRTAADLLGALGVNPQEVIVVCNDRVILHGTGLREGDHVQLLSVISGG